MNLSPFARLATALVSCAGVALLAAPSASAEVVDLDILPGLSFGPTTPFGVGCTYVAVARTADLSGPRVGISPGGYDAVMPIEEFMWQFDGYWSSPVVLGHKVSLWTPTAPGVHSLMAYETSAGGPVATVTVNPAISVGPICLVAP
ncbi:hypothetical protein [Rhodococcoides yunnanense]|jgi:hypothetical protein|uniref:hypothetical protein n=1 Tax=Rhodococcoides yunnanense TaxID=278209 RepID=UPI000960CC97|nr:hypothetical protein [Rhodococcus yunnanensis]MCZ4278980.1 hypothetical protein [Rhodococcus yunnanensis]OLT36159.1 hypothetical protein BJF84_11155 [Rhodococcus sp. CUA-806]